MAKRTCSNNGEFFMSASMRRFLLRIAVFFLVKPMIRIRLPFYQRLKAVNENSFWAIY
jgi:hypothetical protein